MEHPETAATVRVANGGMLATDGPFGAVKEALGGYLFFEAENLDAAIELSGQVTPREASPQRASKMGERRA